MGSRKKKVMSVLCVASVVLVWRVYVMIARYVPSKAKADPAVTAVDFDAAGRSDDAARAREDLTSIWEQQETAAEQPWGRDPFGDVPGAIHAHQPIEVEVGLPDDKPPPGPSSLAFTGVSRSDGRWLAVVRQRIVRVGDTIDEEYRVIEITKRSITLTSGRWAFRYELDSEEAVVRPLSEEQ